MTNRHRHKHRRKKRLFKKRDLKIYIGISIVCFFIAAILFFAMEKGGALLDKFDRVADVLPEQAVLEDIKKSLEAEAQISVSGKKSKSSGPSINRSSLKSVEKAAREKLSPEEIERLKNAYRQFKDNNR